MRAAFLILVVVVLGTGCEAPAPDAGRAFKASGEVIALGGGDGGAARACFACHGLDGAGDGVSTPRLAGLDPGYLHKQMQDYAVDARVDPVMTPIAKRLDQNDRRAVAAYYAAMRPPRGGTAAGPAPSVYLVGDPSRGVPACAACHAADGRGVGPGNPALAGQPAAYTLDQLQRWKRAERRNDPRGVMTAAVASLTEPQMRAIAAWLERKPASPPPDNAAASVSVAEEAAAKLAASREARRPDR
jgi:cytochrome c553